MSAPPGVDCGSGTRGGAAQLYVVRCIEYGQRTFLSVMDIVDEIVKAETLFPQSFADMIERPWGLLFLTPTIRDSHDGNHACILGQDAIVPGAVRETVSFYRARGLQPRVNYVSAAGDRPTLRNELARAGFSSTVGAANHFFVFKGPCSIVPSACHWVRQVRSVDEKLLEAFTSVRNQRMAKVLQRRLLSPTAWLFVAEADDVPVSVALLEQAGAICRVDEVNTAVRARGKGYARAVIYALVQYYERHIQLPLYLYTDNPIAERIYVEAGFVRLNRPITTWSAWHE